MTYDEATRHATWDEALVYALGKAAFEQGLKSSAWCGPARALLGLECAGWALSRELTLADRDPYEFRLSAYPFAYPTGPSVVLS